MAVDEPGTKNLWHSLPVLRVAQTLSVELALGLTCLLVHLGHDALDQVNLRAEVETGKGGGNTEGEVVGGM